MAVIATVMSVYCQPFSYRNDAKEKGTGFLSSSKSVVWRVDFEQKHSTWCTAPFSLPLSDARGGLTYKCAPWREDENSTFWGSVPLWPDVHIFFFFSRRPSITKSPNVLSRLKISRSTATMLPKPLSSPNVKTTLFLIS